MWLIVSGYEKGRGKNYHGRRGENGIAKRVDVCLMCAPFQQKPLLE